MRFGRTRQGSLERMKCISDTSLFLHLVYPVTAEASTVTVVGLLHHFLRRDLSTLLINVIISPTKRTSIISRARIHVKSFFDTFAW